MTGSRAVLALEDGTCYEGAACGTEGVTRGEVVFNTSMTGYQEVLTDPSYAGQIVTMTAPEMGNYGTTPLDEESRRPFVAGFIVCASSPVASNWRSSMTLRDFLRSHHIVGLSGIDTRALTRRLRAGGCCAGRSARAMSTWRAWSITRAPRPRWQARTSSAMSRLGRRSMSMPMPVSSATGRSPCQRRPCRPSPPRARGGPETQGGLWWPPTISA